MQIPAMLLQVLKRILLWYVRKRGVQFIRNYFRPRGYSEGDIKVASTAVSVLVASVIQALTDVLIQVISPKGISKPAPPRSQ